MERGARQPSDGNINYSIGVLDRRGYLFSVQSRNLLACVSSASPGTSQRNQCRHSDTCLSLGLDENSPNLFVAVDHLNSLYQLSDAHRLLLPTLSPVRHSVPWTFQQGTHRRRAAVNLHLDLEVPSPCAWERGRPEIGSGSGKICCSSRGE